jgi:hypothetical protein
LCLCSVWILEPPGNCGGFFLIVINEKSHTRKAGYVGRVPIYGTYPRLGR